MKIYNSVTELIGNTPILKVNNLMKKHNIKSNLLLKLESFNPMSSVKDRIGYAMLKNAVENNIVTKQTTIIEPTSGNTGIALAFVCASLGYKLVLTMPETMSVERQKILLALGAKLVLTDGKLGMKGAISKANELMKAIPNSVILGQFSNEQNPNIHKLITAREIINDTNGQVAAFVAGVGTGGTITGVGEVLKQEIENVKIFAVEPSDSPMLSKSVAGSHKIQGIGAGFVPQILNVNVYNEIITITFENAVWAAKELAKTEGVLVGISGGAALFAAMEIAKRKEFEQKNVVVLMPDSGERYLSTTLFD